MKCLAAVLAKLVGRIPLVVVLVVLLPAIPAQAITAGSPVDDEAPVVHVGIDGQRQWDEAQGRWVERPGLGECAGVHLNEYWVLTAAHCVAAGDFRNDIGMVGAKPARRVVVHPSWPWQPTGPGAPTTTPADDWVDLALIRTARQKFANAVPIINPDVLMPLHIRPMYGQNHDDASNETALAIGHAQQQPEQECSEDFANGLGLTYNSAAAQCYFMDHGYAETICPGDSGGPTTAFVDDREGLVAITSLGISYQDCATKYVAMEVWAQLHWIVCEVGVEVELIGGDEPDCDEEPDDADPDNKPAPDHGPVDCDGPEIQRLRDELDALSAEAQQQLATDQAAYDIAYTQYLADYEQWLADAENVEPGGTPPDPSSAPQPPTEPSVSPYLTDAIGAAWEALYAELDCLPSEGPCAAMYRRYQHAILDGEARWGDPLPESLIGSDLFQVSTDELMACFCLGSNSGGPPPFFPTELGDQLLNWVPDPDEGDAHSEPVHPCVKWFADSIEGNGGSVPKDFTDAWNNGSSNPWAVFDRGVSILVFGQGTPGGSGGGTSAPLPCALFAMTPTGMSLDQQEMTYDVEWRGSGCGTTHTECRVPMNVVLNNGQADYARSHCAPV